MELVCKVCVTVVNFQLNRRVTLHKALNGFRAVRVVVTSTLEAKLAQQLAGIAHKPLFQVLLDMHKTYNPLYRGWSMDIFRGYGVGQNTARIIAHHWGSLLFVLKASRFLGIALGTGRGVMQGDPTSPMIFNIVMDEVVRAVLEVVCGPHEVRHGMGWAAGEWNLFFYLDDGKIVGRDHIWVNYTLTVALEMF